MVGKRLDNHPITISPVVKELTNHPPLMEARANWKGIGAFRAIFFFEIDDKGNQWIYFTKALIKESTFSQDFEDAIQESISMRHNYIKPE